MEWFVLYYKCLYWKISLAEPCAKRSGEKEISDLVNRLCEKFPRRNLSGQSLRDGSAILTLSITERGFYEDKKYCFEMFIYDTSFCSYVQFLRIEKGTLSCICDRDMGDLADQF
jgi:hypothetical protein